MTWDREKIQVNIPFILLKDTYLERFLDYGLNPEIGVDAEALDRCVLSEFEDIAKRLQGRGLNITLHAPFMDLSPGSPDPEIRRVTRHRFEQVLPLLPVFKPRTVVCHANYDAKRYSYMRETWVENSVDLWMWLAERVRDEGAQLVLENVYEHGPGDIQVIFERLVTQRVGFCLDTGHHAVFSRVPLETWVAALGPFLEQVHLHDNSGEQDDHLALGRGRVRFKMLFQELRAIRDTPPILTLEPHSEADLWPSLEYLEAVWPW